MIALSTLLPVFFMVVLGIISRVKGWITQIQKDGANTIVFNILFPILIFNILFGAKISLSSIYIVGYVFIAFIIAMLTGRFLSGFIGEKFSHLSHYMLPTCEGGNVALPLYVSIVGVAHASNTVIFDLAGVLIAFVVIPVLVARKTSHDPNVASLLKNIFSNSFVLAVLLGLVLNLSGFYTILENSDLFDIYLNIINTATAPIMSIILFVIGYNLQISLEILGPLIKLLLVRVGFYVLVILGFFALFPNLINDKMYFIAVFIYFMCPTGFAVPMQISPLYRKEDDANFTSAFISLNMIVTLIAYAFIVLFVV